MLSPDPSISSTFDRASAFDFSDDGETVGNLDIAAYDTITQAEAIWRHLETHGVATAYQRYDWLDAWHRHIGVRLGVEPRILTITENGRPVLLMPLGLLDGNGLRRLRFLGGTHSNYNLGIFDRSFMIRATGADMRRILKLLGDIDGRVDMLELRNQPETWMGLRNPLSLLPHRPSASCAFSTRLTTDFESFLKARRGSKGRKKLRWQERALEKVGGYGFRRAEDAEEGHRVLEAFSQQKAARFRAQGIHNVFAEPGVMEFLHDLVDKSAVTPDTRVLELYYLLVGGKIRATFAGSSCGNRFSGFFNSISTDEFSRTSPGEMLLALFLKSACDRRLFEFDLGVGEARYKAAWCDRTERLFDTVLGFTLRGKTAATVKRTKLSAKRCIKQNAGLWSAVTRSRQYLLGRQENGSGPSSSTISN